MKLHEVRKPGNKFKRPIHEAWMYLSEGGTVFHDGRKVDTYEYDDDDLDASDWEVEEPVVITRQTLQEAYTVMFGVERRSYLDDIFLILKEQQK